VKKYKNVDKERLHTKKSSIEGMDFTRDISAKINGTNEKINIIVIIIVSSDMFFPQKAVR